MKNNETLTMGIIDHVVARLRHATGSSSHVNYQRAYFSLSQMTELYKLNIHLSVFMFFLSA